MAGPIRTVIGGVDTHKDTHVVAALSEQAALLGTASFPTSSAGYGQLLDWLRDFGTVTGIGIEGTGSYGAGLCRFLQAAGVLVREVSRPSKLRRNSSTFTLESDLRRRLAPAERSLSMPYAEANSLRMYYEEQGSGPPLVLLNGATGTLDEVWRAGSSLWPYLSQQYRVVQFEPRGNGRTDNPGGQDAYTFATLASDTAALIEHLGLTPAHVAGFSEG